MSVQDRDDDRTADGLPPFPSEAGWLDGPFELPAARAPGGPDPGGPDPGGRDPGGRDPGAGDPDGREPDFVDRTVAALARAGLVRLDPVGSAPDLPAAALADFAPPPPSAGFVERALTRVQAERAAQWRRLLLQYEAPAPTADFVDRTLAALGAGRGAAPAVTPARWRTAARQVLSWRGLTVAAAAAVVLVLAWPQRPGAALRDAVAGAAVEVAYAGSPSLLSHLLADDLEPAHLAVDPTWLWLHEVRR